MTNERRISGSALLALALIGCGDPGPPPSSEPSVTVLYGDPETTELLPYPSNRYTVPADRPTGLAVAIPTGTPDLVVDSAAAEVVAELEAMDGFSTTGGIMVGFDGPVDYAAWAAAPEAGAMEPPVDASRFQQADSPFVLVDVDPASPDHGRAIGLVPRYWATDPAADVVQDHTLIALPAQPLRPGTRYLFAVTDALKAEDGTAVARSDEGDALMAAATSGSGGAYASEVGEGLAVVEESIGIAPARVVLATSFTTASVTGEMFRLAEAARQTPAPVLLEDWSIEEDPSDARVILRAVFEAPEYRQPLPDGRFVIGASGAPEIQAKVGLEVFMAVSDEASTSPRQMVIYGHGLGGDKGGVSGASTRLAPLNAAVLSIDSPHHGSRAEAGAAGLDAVFKFFGIDNSDPDNQTFVIGRARDNFRQMAADQLELVRLIRSLEGVDLLPFGNPDGVPDFDTSRIFYIGHSFGSVQGATIAALAPEISHITWNVGGAGLMMLLRDSNTFRLVVNGLRPEGVSDGALARFMAITQAIVDPGDPLNYAPHVLREPTPGVTGWAPREVLLQEVIADTIVPNSSTRALARATGLALQDAIEPVSGLPLVTGAQTANLSSGTTGVMAQFDTMDGGKQATHGELYFSAEGLGQYLSFFQSALTAEHATVNSAY
ncbi:MAG: hypothetical protein R3B72_14870 [Polyangiaceae bacterium]